MFTKRLLVPFVIVLIVAGCGQKSSSLTGKFESPAGSLEFLPGNKVKVDLLDKHLWMIGYTGGKNHETYTYRFVNSSNNTVPPGEAKRINYSKGERYISSNRIEKVEDDKIVFDEPRLGKDNTFIKK